jgi:hypothetical protein
MRRPLIVAAVCGFAIVGASGAIACGGGGTKDATPTAQVGANAKTSASKPASVSPVGTPGAAPTAAGQPAEGPTVVTGSGSLIVVPIIPPELAPSTPIGGENTPLPDVTRAATPTVVAPPLPTIAPATPPAPIPAAGAAFVASAPASASGDFYVAVSLAGNVPPWKGYGILIQYDPSVVVAQTDTKIGNLFADPAKDAFCPNTVVSPDGTVSYGCVRPGTATEQTTGVAAVIHFKTVAKGTTRLHLVTYDQATASATLLLDANSDPLKVDTVDAVVVVP